MLIEQITDAWIKYQVTGENPRWAFLYVISNYPAADFAKVLMLKGIMEKVPGITMSDDELFQAFCRLAERAELRHEVLSWLELNWVTVYIKSPEIHTKIEDIVYRSLLIASDRSDAGRKVFKWGISEERRRTITVDVIMDTDIGSKRKMQLAREIGWPTEVHARDYFKTLLRGNHYDIARALGLKDTDMLVIEVIVDHLNAGLSEDAFSLALEFLSKRQDVIDEIKKIDSALATGRVS